MNYSAAFGVVVVCFGAFGCSIEEKFAKKNVNGRTPGGFGSENSTSLESSELLVSNASVQLFSSKAGLSLTGVPREIPVGSTYRLECDVYESAPPANNGMTAGTTSTPKTFKIYSLNGADFKRSADDTAAVIVASRVAGCALFVTLSNITLDNLSLVGAFSLVCANTAFVDNNMMTGTGTGTSTPTTFIAGATFVAQKIWTCDVKKVATGGTVTKIGTAKFTLQALIKDGALIMAGLAEITLTNGTVYKATYTNAIQGTVGSLISFLTDYLPGSADIKLSCAPVTVNGEKRGYDYTCLGKDSTMMGTGEDVIVACPTTDFQGVAYKMSDFVSYCDRNDI